MVIVSFLVFILILHFMFKLLRLEIDKTVNGDILLWYNGTRDGYRKYFFIYKKKE